MSTITTTLIRDGMVVTVQTPSPSFPPPHAPDLLGSRLPLRRQLGVKQAEPKVRERQPGNAVSTWHSFVALHRARGCAGHAGEAGHPAETTLQSTIYFSCCRFKLGPRRTSSSQGREGWPVCGLLHPSRVPGPPPSTRARTASREGCWWGVVGWHVYDVLDVQPLLP